jgi:diguanylate cyclase (GGDEF)-like protein/PAS domain S-box-containing protein
LSVPYNPEEHRLASLRNLWVLDTEAESAFDAVAHMAAQVCGVPIALVSLVDAERQWFKANVGLPRITQAARESAFCDHAIRGSGLMEVPDALQDPRFSNHPLVAGEPSVRFYAGAPLRLPDGATVGALCVMDRKPRQLTPEQRDMLCALRDIVVGSLEMRRSLLLRAMQVRTEMEHNLEAREFHFRSLVESQSELVSLATESGKILYVNPRYAALFGKQPSEMLGCSLYDFVAPQDQGAVRSLLREVLDSGLNQQGENRMVSSEGATTWVAWTNSLRVDPDGQRRLMSVGRDITAQVHAQQALQASEDLLVNTGRLAGVGGWELDVRTQRLTWSAQTRRIHQVDDDYVPTVEGAVAFYAPEVRAPLEVAIQTAISGDADGWDLELPFVTHKQHHRWVRALGKAIWEDGAVVRLAGAIQDITDRKRLEQRLHENTRFLREMTDNLPFRLSYIDHKQIILFVNQAACESVGLSRDHTVGKHYSDAMPYALTQALQQHLPLALQGQAQTWTSVEMSALEERVLEFKLSPDALADGQVQGVFLTGTDVTERDMASKTQRVLNTIFEKTTDFVVQTDNKGAVVYMNPAVRKALALSADAPLTGVKFSDFNTPQTAALYLSEILPAARERGVWSGITTVYVAGQRIVPVSHMVIAHTDHEGRVQRYSAVMRDMTELLEAQRNLEQQTATLRSVTESIPAGVAVVGADDRIRFANSAIARWFGKERFELVGQPYAGALGPEDAPANAAVTEQVLAGEVVTFERELTLDQSPVHVAVTYIPLASDAALPQSYVVVGHDITQHRQESVRLVEMAQRDPLTGLLNREGLKQYVAHNARVHHHAADAVLYIDLDLFKEVNDQHGHPVGDLLLQQFASRLLSVVRPSDAVARLGGDEFVMALEGMRSLPPVERIANKVLALARMPFTIGELTVQVAASVGIAMRHRGATWESMMAQADEMLYAAKRAGKGQFKGPER